MIDCINKKTAAGLFAAAILLVPVNGALAGKSVAHKTTTVTTKTTKTTTTVTTVVRQRTHRHRQKIYVRKPRHGRYAQPHVRYEQPRSHAPWEAKPRYKVKTKRAKLKKPQTKRHRHSIKGYHGKHHKITGFNHKHGHFEAHTHRSDDFITIHPSATQWPVPRPHSSLMENLPLPSDVLRRHAGRALEGLDAIQVAVVVKEKSNGVTIIRNVKEIRDSGEDVPSDSLIGVTEFPRPFYVLTEEELEECKRPLRTVGGGDGASIQIKNATYCE